MDETLNQLKEAIKVWPEYISDGDNHATIIRVQGKDSKRYYLKKIIFVGKFQEFVKEVFKNILESDPDTAFQVDPKQRVYELDEDQRSDIQILNANLKITSEPSSSSEAS